MVPYRGAVDLLDAGDDLGGDHDGVAGEHLLEHEDPEVEVVDEGVLRVPPGVGGCQGGVGGVPAAVGRHERRRVARSGQRRAVVHPVHHHVRQLGKVPT